MAKYLIVGDLHLKNDDKFSSLKNDTLNDTLKESFDTLDWIDNIASDNSADGIIFLGDCFDNPEKNTTEALTAYSKMLSNLSLSRPIIIITGNHELVNDKEEIFNLGDKTFAYKPSALSYLNYFQNITIIDKPTICTIDGTDIDLIMIPYSNNIRKSFEELNFKNKNNKRLVLGHFEIKTAWHEKFLENKGENLITINEITDQYKINKTFLGHIHDPEIIWEKNGNKIEYLGACRNTNFSNNKEDKFIYLLDTDRIFNEEEDLIKFKNNYTPIYKTFNSIDELTEYVNNANDEKLAKTKVKFRYNNIEQLKEMNKIKQFFKSVKYEKVSLDVVTNSGTNISKEDLEELGSLLQNSILDDEKIIDYSFKFVEPSNKEKALKVLEIIRRIKG